MSRKLKERQLSVVVACVVDSGFSTMVSASKADEADQKELATKVLLARRRESEQKEIDLMWELPGGKIEPNETQEQAVVREVQEETGYQVEVVGEVPFSYTTHWEYQDFIQHTFVYCYECKLQHRSPKNTSDHKIKEFQWFDVEDIDFSRTLPGSREFIWYIARKHSIDLKTYAPNIAYATFTRIEPSKNMAKYYSIVLQISPQAERPYIVTTRHGRLGWRGTGKPFVQEFASDREARDEIIRRLKDRRSHRYALTDYSDNFPFRAFLEEYPELDNTIRQPSLFD